MPTVSGRAALAAGHRRNTLATLKTLEQNIVSTAKAEQSLLLLSTILRAEVTQFRHDVLDVCESDAASADHILHGCVQAFLKNIADELAGDGKG